MQSITKKKYKDESRGRDSLVLGMICVCCVYRCVWTIVWEAVISIVSLSQPFMCFKPCTYPAFIWKICLFGRDSKENTHALCQGLMPDGTFWLKNKQVLVNWEVFILMSALIELHVTLCLAVCFFPKGPILERRWLCIICGWACTPGCWFQLLFWGL